MYEVSSEIYKETNFEPVKSGDEGKVLSKFKFRYPAEAAATTDKDGDLLLQRRPWTDEIVIEHSETTVLRLVGLQVWRGALLLADYFFHCRKDFRDAQVLELGAGVGLTSIAAALCGVRRVICTDVDIGGILNLIRGNVARNRKLFSAGGGADVQVLEYNFMQPPQEYAVDLLRAIDESDVVLAADVIYDDALTDAFVAVIERIFERQTATGRRKTVFVALEKRYVFTLAELDTVAPMFEYFLRQTSKKPWRFEYVELDFPQYFEYERCKDLVLLKLTCISG